jgi:hypothetical protein
MNDITWYADLGIEIKPDQEGKESSYCWRMVPPAPVTDWSDPCISPTAAYRAACAELCHLAWQGRAAMERELIEIGPDGDGTMVYGQVGAGGD